MTKPFRIALAILGLFSALNSAPAQQQPQVAFIGDNLTYEWQQQPQFQANQNWLPYGFTPSCYPCAGRGTAVALSELQQIIASGKKPIIHLVVGQADADGVDAGGNQQALIFAVFATNFEKIITTALAAKLEIIVGTIPYASLGDVAPLNLWLVQYCNAHSIPVINYDFALNSGQGFAASRGPVAPSPVYYNPPTTPAPGLPPNLPSLTSAGYNLITDMAETQIGLTAGTFKLIGGYLNDVTLEDLEDAQSVLNANTVVDGSTIQFTPYGEFSDGKTRIINNADQYGHVGIWTSSSPTVVYMNQFGVGTSFSKGSSNIHFTTNSGITFSEWTMYTDIDDPCGCLSNY
jgi:hypothetical protein